MSYYFKQDSLEREGVVLSGALAVPHQVTTLATVPQHGLSLQPCDGAMVPPDDQHTTLYNQLTAFDPA